MKPALDVERPGAGTRQRQRCSIVAVLGQSRRGDVDDGLAQTRLDLTLQSVQQRLSVLARGVGHRYRLARDDGVGCSDHRDYGPSTSIESRGRQEDTGDSA